MGDWDWLGKGASGAMSGAATGAAAGGPLGAIVGGLGGGLLGIFGGGGGYDYLADPNIDPALMPRVNSPVQNPGEAEWGAMSDQEKLAYLSGGGGLESQMQDFGSWVQRGQKDAAGRVTTWLPTKRELMGKYGTQDWRDRYAEQIAAMEGRMAPAIGMMEAAARGRVPSEAELLMQQGLEGAFANQLSAAAANRGAGIGAQMPGLASTGANATLAANQQAGVLRAQEMAQARQQYMAALAAQEQMRNQYLAIGLQEELARQQGLLGAQGLQASNAAQQAQMNLQLMQMGARAASDAAAAYQAYGGGGGASTSAAAGPNQAGGAKPAQGIG